MSVAAFFRDTKTQSVMSGLKPSNASEVIGDFFKSYDYEDCTVDQLLALSDLALRSKDYNVSRAALQKVIDTGTRLHLAYYKLGRLNLALKEYPAALEEFEQGIAADDEFPFNYMGAARTLHAMGRRMDAAAPAERFVGFDVRPHAAEELTILADIAHAIFESGDRRRSRPIYQLIRQFDQVDLKVTLRLAEALIACDENEPALELLDPLGLQGKLDIWGRRALAFCHSKCGNHERAIELAEAVAMEVPSDPGFVATYLDVLVRSRQPRRMEEALQKHPSLFDIGGMTELKVRVTLSTGDVQSAANALLKTDISRHTRLYYLTFETSYAALNGAFTSLAQSLSDRLFEVAADDVNVAMLRVDVFFRQQMWEEAGEALQTIPAGERDRPQVLLKRFEYACFISDSKTATELWQILETMDLPSKQFMLPVFRFLAEQQRWDDLVDRALGWLDTSFNYEQIGYVLFRAAKHTQRQRDFIAAIESIGGSAASRDLAKLRAALLWDRAETLADIEVLARDPALATDPVFSRRMNVKRELLSRVISASHRNALFLCTNRNYLCATFVALHSATKVTDPRGTDFFIVVDDDLVDLTNTLAQNFRDKGFVVSVVPASHVVDTAAKLYATYGLFTSGHMLASAAYYRIYFAKHLEKTGDYHRAVYIDSDILVTKSLDALFTTDLMGKPMGARPETPRPEVRRASAMHGISEDQYFNSGVLLFDLKNQRLPTGLDGAVAAIADDNVTLLFHDQCALNVGFKGTSGQLAMGWNFPVVESTRIANLPQNATILHFLDRPKPWSAAYSGECAIMWFDQWRETASFIGEAQAVQLFGMTSD